MAKRRRLGAISGAMIDVAMGQTSPSRRELIDVLEAVGPAMTWLLGRTVAVDHAEAAKVQECRAVAARVHNALKKAGR